MQFRQTALAGVHTIELDRIEDDRGFFARTWCRNEFAAHGLSTDLVQCSISFNRRKGTLRGMHCQVSPHAETKLVRCTMGAIHDVLIDLRPSSRTFRKWESFELTAMNRLMLYIPEGIAHGFQTLEDNSEVFYQMSEFYAPECATGVRWNDPAFAIQWPIASPILSIKDQQYPDFQP